MPTFRIAVSKQKNVRFAYCDNPIILDKSKDWGPGNKQVANHGCFLKLDDKAAVVSHLVQPNKDKSAPIGWTRTNKPGYFDKNDICVLRELSSGEKVMLNTKDGKINYVANGPSYIVCNTDSRGYPDTSDPWVISKPELEKSYKINPSIKNYNLPNAADYI